MKEEKKNIKDDSVEEKSENSPEELKKQLEEILSDKINIYILQKLRQGPIKTESFHKLLKGKFRKMKFGPEKYMKKLLEYNFVKKYDYIEKLEKNDTNIELFPNLTTGSRANFYILVKDFYAIRKPPMEILNKLGTIDINSDSIKKFRKEIEEYFNRYTNTKTTGDDLDVIKIFLNTPLFLTINKLSQDIAKYSQLSDYIKNELKINPKQIIDALLELEFIKILPLMNSDEKVVVLKSSFEVESLFPEYLIRNISQLMADKKLNKHFALITLNHLKRFYLELEKPEILHEYQENINLLEEKFSNMIEGSEKIKIKKIKKIYTELRDQYQKIGSISEIQNLDSSWNEFLKNKE